jgi:hypothetical protein
MRSIIFEGNTWEAYEFLLAFAMQRIQHVVFKFDTKIGSFAVGKFHASDFAPFAARSKGKP